MPISAGKVRFCLPNRYGTKPLSCKEIVLTLPNGNKYLITYDNQKQIVIPAQQDLWTDWLNCSLNAGDWLRFEAKLTIKQPHTLIKNIDRLALKTYPKVHKQTWMISGIEVQTESNYNSLAFFGDSLTDQGLYVGKVYELLNQDFGKSFGFQNYGRSGNRMLHDAHSTNPWNNSFGPAGINRIKQIFATKQCDYLVFMQGINDLIHPGTISLIQELPSAEELIRGINGIRQLVESHNCQFIPMTITPFKTSLNDQIPDWDEAKEAIRQEVNAYIMTLPNAFDAAKEVSANSDPQLLNPDYDCGDHTHFSVAGGHAAMKNVGKCMIMFYFHTLRSICAFHFSYQRLR